MHPDVEKIAVLNYIRTCHIGVFPYVRRRVESEVLQRDGVRGSNYRTASIRKISRMLLFEQRRNDIAGSCSLHDSQAFVISEEESAVVNDGATDAATKLILPVLGST